MTIGAGVRIGAGARVRDAIILDNSFLDVCTPHVFADHVYSLFLVVDSSPTSTVIHVRTRLVLRISVCWN